MTEPGGANPQADYTFGQIAIRENLCAFEHVKECLDIQNKLRGLGIEPKKLGEILVEKGYLTPEQVAQIARLQTTAASSRKVTIPGYEILSKIGQGAMGSVYKGKQVSMDRIVAVKVMAPRYSKDRSFVERFLREARAVAKLNHENIIGGIDVGEANGIHYFVMEYVDGIPVSTIMRREKRIEERRCLEIAQQVARALTHAHKHGIVHRDIKPENIMITKDGVAKLCDLGLAKSARGDAAATMDGTSVGTPNYISPEQARGEENIDIRTDIYSLGASLYHMATGTTAFSGANPMVVMTKHVTEFADPPHKRYPGLSQGFSNLVMKMMSKRREDRPQSPAAVMEDLDQLLRGGEVLAPVAAAPAKPSTAIPTRPQTERRLAPSSAAIRGGMRARQAGSKTGLYIGVGAVGALLVILIVMFSGRGTTTPPPRPNPRVPPRPGPTAVNPKPPTRPVSAVMRQRIRDDITDFRGLVDSQIEDRTVPDRFTRHYLTIKDKIRTYQRQANFAGEKAWRDEEKTYVSKINGFISTHVWSAVKSKAESHSNSGRYSKALAELDELEEVYKWLRVDVNPPLMTAAGKAHKEMKKRINDELDETYLKEAFKADQLFGDAQKRGEAYRLLDALAVSMSSKNLYIEETRAKFFSREISEILGPAPSVSHYSKALQRVGQLKQLHAGNGSAGRSLDQLAEDLKRRSAAASTVAASKATDVYRTNFVPKFEGVLKYRNLGGARAELNRVCHAPELADVQSTLLAFWGDRALLKSFLDPARRRFKELRRVVSEAEQAYQSAAQAGDDMARDLAFDIRTAALLEEFMEQALKGALNAGRDSRKFRSYSPALSSASSASAAPRDSSGEIALRASGKSVYLVPRKGLPSVTEEDIVQLARRSYSTGTDFAARADRDQYFQLKTLLLHVYAGRLSEAKSAFEAITAPIARMGIDRFADRLKNVTSAAVELAARKAYEEAWNLYDKEDDEAGGAKKFVECAEKYSTTQYMQERTPSGRTRLEIIRDLFGSGGSGSGQPMGNAEAVFGTNSVRNLGGNRYEITYRFRTDEELKLWKAVTTDPDNPGVQTRRDPGGLMAGGEGIWSLGIPFKGDVELEVSFSHNGKGSMGFLLHGDGDRAGYVTFVDLSLPAVGSLDAMFRLPLGQGLEVMQAVVAKGGTGLRLTRGARQKATFTRKGTSMRFTLDGGELRGTHAAYNRGNVGIAFIKAAGAIFSVRVKGEIEDSWLDARR